MLTPILAPHGSGLASLHEKSGPPTGSTPCQQQYVLRDSGTDPDGQSVESGHSWNTSISAPIDVPSWLPEEPIWGVEQGP